jgi:hypothetical protein
MITKTVSTAILYEYTPETSPRRVLLFNPPVYDTRFPWSRWQQPVALLQLATLLGRHQCDVRLIDALYFQSDERLTRRRIRKLSRGEVPINYWRYGQLQPELTLQLEILKKEGWQPDDVYIDGFTTFWWEGVVEAIAVVRQKFPHARVILCGAYPSFATEHAEEHSDADIFVVGSLEGLAGLPLDLSLYPYRPKFTYLSIGTERRPSSDVIDEFLAKANPVNQQERIGRFAFADHNVIGNYPEQFRTLLKVIIDRKLKVSLYALGNIYTHDLVDDPELASLLFRAGFKQLVFADDRSLPLTEEAREDQLESYRNAIDHCIKAGYRWRTEDLVGSVCIGRPGEKIEDPAAFMAKIAHTAGSLIVIPYQPLPAECPSNISLEYQNGKLFPFAEYNGVSYRKYQDILGLAAILNTKYRSRTFDFLGDGLISRLVRASLVNESWDPHKTASLQNDRPVTVGWFNKEGKWVRS